MRSPTLTNCPRCGRVFVKSTRSICPSCIEEVEREYQACADYLRENRTSTIYELSEATGVSVNQITRFIREGRLSIKDNPNMGVPCEGCGKLIQTGHYCDECAERLKKEVGSILGQDEPKRPAPKNPLGGIQVKDAYKKD